MNANNLLFEKALSGIIEESTGIKTYNAFDLGVIDGKQDKVLLLTNTTNEERITNNATMNNGYSLSFVVQADELLAVDITQEALNAFTAVQNALNGIPRYSVIGGAVLLSVSDIQLKIAYSDAETDYNISFDMVIQF